MNILPKKKWHVRTKENMARVRRDEAKAAAEQQAIDERVKLADHEDRIRRLKTRNSANYGPAFFTAKQSTSTADPDEESQNNEGVSGGQSAHVNLFAELEEQERKNLGQGNKEYAAEKKKEGDEWESKMGIMKRFAEDTKEFSKEKYWWENIPIVREPLAGKKDTEAVLSVPKPLANISAVSSKEIKVLQKPRKESKKSHKKHHKHDKHDKSKKHKRKHSGSSSESLSESERKPLKKSASDKGRSKLEKLRAERLEREKIEKQRAIDLLKPKKEPEQEIRSGGQQKKLELETERSRKYNPQFNPEFVRK
uniref:CBF1-interacting co-repressor CIR N-terminal domain-containing protein n=1 Tax=Ditylenchus dipsaci TaxID=166011 RepID=A0A915CWF5_9BILA